MKKLLLALSLLSPVFCFSQSKKALPKTYDLLIGTYTNTGKSKGIYVYRFYAETGKVAYLNEIDTDDPSYLAISTDNKFVYAVNENAKGPGGVSAFKFDAASGKLDLLNRQQAAGSPAYVSVDKNRKNVFVANYGGGSLQAFPVNDDGSLGAIAQTIQDTGGGIDKKRQEGPHVHAGVLTPDGKYLMYTDLGTDKINIYRYKASKTAPLNLESHTFLNAIPGNGPRHIEFSPNGRFMYNIQEMGGAITAYTYNNGKANVIQTVSMLAPGFKGSVGAADIHISPDGMFLYATNRGSANDIGLYTINQENGQLTFVERYKTGNGPRNFIIDPTGSFILVANQNSNNISFFRIDKHTGKLTTLLEPNKGVPVSTLVKLDIGAPVCLKMVPVK